MYRSHPDKAHETDTRQTSKTDLKRRLSDRGDMWNVIPYTLSLFVLLISIYASYTAFHAVQKQNFQHFEHKVMDIGSALKNRIHLYEEALQHTLAFIYASENVEPEEWVTFIDTLQIEKTLPDITGIGFVDAVNEKNLPAYLHEMRKLYGQDFVNRPETKTADKYIVKNIHPKTKNESALGLDIGFEKRRRTAAETARDTGKGTLTEHLSLVQSYTEDPGFLLFMPSYKTRTIPETLEERRQHHNGWVYSSIMSKELFQHLTHTSNNELNFTIYANNKGAQNGHIFKTSTQPMPKSQASKYSMETTIKIANTKWRIEWEPSIYFQPPGNEKKAYITAIGGFIVSILLFVTLHHIINLRTLIAQKVKDRTAELKEVTERYDVALEGASVGLWDWNIKTGDLFWSDRFLEIAGMEAPTSPPKFIDFIDRIHHNDHALALNALSKHIENKEPYDIEYRLRQDNGKFIWIHAKGQAIWNENDKATRMAGSINDITHKKQSESDLKFKNHLLEIAEKTAKLGHWIYDIENKSMYWSDAVYNIHGVDKEAYTPEIKGFSDFYHVEDMECAQDALDDCINESKPFEYRLRIVRQDNGKTLYVRNIGTPEIDKYGRVKSIFGILQDITDMNENEIILQKYKEQTQILVNAIESCQVGVTISDVSDDKLPLTFVNRAFENITGYKSKEVLGKNMNFLNGNATCPDTIKELSHAIKEQKSAHVEILNYKRNGVPFWNNCQISPVYSDENEVIAYVGTQVDMTQHKKVQSELKQERDITSHIIEYSPSLIVGLSADGSIQFANQRTLAIAQTSLQDIVGRKWWESLFDEKDDVRVSELLTQFERNNALNSFEINLTDKAGKTHLVSWTTINLYDNDENLDKIICIGTDLTKERENAKKEQERQKLESLGTMAGGVAHEINNALTPIILLSEDFYSKIDDKDKEGKENLEVIVDYALHARNIVDDILLYSRQTEREQKDYSAKELIDKAISLAKKTLPEDISLTYDIHQDIVDKTVCVNKTGFAQIANNLLNNAAHAMKHSGKIQILASIDHISARRKTSLPKGEYLKLTVIDEGHGITEEDLKLIFDPFFTTKPEGEGSGLGLSVVYGLIKKWGGDITVTSEKDKGSEFTIWIPTTLKSAKKKISKQKVFQ